MPQSSGVNRKSDVPYGTGSVVSSLLEARARTLRRAVKLNNGLDKRCELYEGIISRHQVAENNRAKKVLLKIERSIAELEAYKKVVGKFRADNFTTMKMGFNPRDAKTPNTFKQCQVERRILNTGFSIQTLYPQVLQTIKDCDPERVREVERVKMLHESKKLSDFLIDKRVTNAAILEEERFVDSVRKSDLDFTLPEIRSARESVASRGQLRSRSNSDPTNVHTAPGKAYSERSLKLRPMVVTKSGLKDSRIL